MDHGRQIQDTIEFIEARLTEVLDVEEVIRRTYFSRSYYQRIFSSLVGEPMMEYVKKRRLSMAGQELAESNRPVIDIALQFGYGSHEGFTRAFKAYHGITPAQCRKYRLFHVFDKKYVLREAVSMQSNHLINVSDFISEESAKRLAQNTEKMAGKLDGFCKKIRGVAQSAVEKERESGVSGDVFTKIARETQLLAGRTEACAREIKEFRYGVIEKSKRVCFAELTGQVMVSIKCLDDIAFQMNIITFFLNLNIGRTGEPFREKIAPVGEAYLLLTSELVIEKEKIVEISKDFLSLVLQDMQKEAEERKLRVVRTLCETAKAVASVAALVSDEEDKAGGCGGFRVLTEEIQAIANEQTKSIRCVEAAENESPEDWLREAGQARKVVDDQAFRVNILAFAAALELSRTPEEKGLSAATEQIVALAGKLHEAAAKMRFALDEIKQLHELAEASALQTATCTDKKTGRAGDKHTEPSFVKQIGDMAFQGNILYFAMKMENEKIKGVLAEEDVDAFNGYAKRADHVISVLHALQAEAEGGQEAALSFGGVADELASLSADIQSAAGRIGVHGGAFAYIAAEYRSFADRVRQVGH